MLSCGGTEVCGVTDLTNVAAGSAISAIGGAVTVCITKLFAGVHKPSRDRSSTGTFVNDASHALDARRVDPAQIDVAGWKRHSSTTPSVAPIESGAGLRLRCQNFATS